MMVFTMLDGLDGLFWVFQHHQKGFEGHQQEWRFSANRRPSPSETLYTVFDGLTAFFFKTTIKSSTTRACARGAIQRNRGMAAQPGRIFGALFPPHDFPRPMTGIN